MQHFYKIYIFLYLELSIEIEQSISVHASVKPSKMHAAWKVSAASKTTMHSANYQWLSIVGSSVFFFTYWPTTNPKCVFVCNAHGEFIAIMCVQAKNRQEATHSHALNISNSSLWAPPRNLCKENDKSFQLWGHIFLCFPWIYFNAVGPAVSVSVCVFASFALHMRCMLLSILSDLKSMDVKMHKDKLPWSFDE